MVKATRKRAQPKASTLSGSKNVSTETRRKRLFRDAEHEYDAQLKRFKGKIGDDGRKLLAMGVPVSDETFSLPRFANQRHAMLYGFSLAGDDGYTDEQAAKAAGLNLRSCFWKRASELRQFGYILPVKNDDGTWLTRKSDLGGTQQVWRMTKAGKKQLELWGWR